MRGCKKTLKFKIGPNKIPQKAQNILPSAGFFKLLSLVLWAKREFFYSPNDHTLTVVIRLAPIGVSIKSGSSAVCVGGNSCEDQQY